MVAEIRGDLPDQLQWTFQIITSEPASDEEISILTKLYQTTLEKYRAREDLWKTMGDSPEASARTLVLSTIFNSDESLTK
jgi:hypothetical protein